MVAIDRDSFLAVGYPSTEAVVRDQKCAARSVFDEALGVRDLSLVEVDAELDFAIDLMLEPT